MRTCRYTVVLRRLGDRAGEIGSRFAIPGMRIVPDAMGTWRVDLGGKLVDVVERCDADGASVEVALVIGAQVASDLSKIFLTWRSCRPASA